LPLWGISVACFHNDQPLAGAIFLPALNECYTATANGPALLNGSAISVSKTANPQQAVVFNSDFNTSPDPVVRERLNAAGIAARRDQVATVMRSRCLGSAVVSSAWVAAGRVDAYLMVRVNAWDIAAGFLIVSRAGGTATGAGGGPWAPGVDHVLLSNGHLHEHLVRPGFLP
jgi:myo-inositol-1(or 4)-monophosphatase